MSQNIAKASAPHIDITSPAAYTNPQELLNSYQWLRENQAISWVDQAPYAPFWAVTKYPDIVEVARNNEVFISGPRLTLIPQEIEEASLRAKPSPLESLRILFALLRNSKQCWQDFQSLSRTRSDSTNAREAQVRTLIQMDEPQHLKYRTLTHRWFMGQGVSRLKPRVSAIAEKYVSRLIDSRDHCEFVDEIANWYPLEVIMLILGLPAEDAPKLLVWTQQLLNAADPEIQKSERYGADVMMEMYAYFSDLISKRRANPTDDLATVIVQSQVDNQPIELVEMLSYFLLIATAGHETTASTISGGVLAFIENPNEYQKLKLSPALAKSAANEIARWVTPVKHFTRTATTDYRLSDTLIAQGESLALFYLSGNRDQDIFDKPNDFLIDRAVNKHLAFGHGAHLCLGKQLALMEVELFFTELSKRVSNLHLNGEVAWVETNFTNGLKRLPIRLDV